jgi:hypothetical protein
MKKFDMIISLKIKVKWIMIKKKNVRKKKIHLFLYNYNQFNLTILQYIGYIIKIEVNIMCFSYSMFI